jgi:CO/xanthine dehydrogenase Mo-binding subunit
MNMFPNSFDSAPKVEDWFSFKENGKVRMVTGKVEIGQGINTAFMQIAAEELDINPDRIQLSAGNTQDKLDGGCTSGSQSMQTEGMSLRKAASAARMVMMEKAAELLQSDMENLEIEDGEFFLNGSSTELTYWSISNDVSLDKSVEQYMKPKSQEKKKLMGKPLKRVDLQDKILGKHIFIHDLEFEDMLHARIIRPPSASSRLISIDKAAINKLPNIEKLIVNGSFVAIVTRKEEYAVSVVNKINQYCKWTEIKTGITDPIEFIKQTDSPLILSLDKGNVETAEGESISTEASRKFLCHASIGPCCSIAHWDKTKLTVYTHSQAVNAMKRTLSSIFDKPDSDIHVQHYHGAGCYGHNGADDVVLDAVLIAKECDGSYVRVVWSREDELSSSPLAPAMVTKIDAKIGDNGQINSFDVHVKSPPHVKRPAGENAEHLLAAEHILKPIKAPDPMDTPLDKGGAADRNSLPLYDIPNIRIRKQIVYDLPWRTSAMRGLGAFVNVYAIETLIDDIAELQDKDPLEFRLSISKDKRMISVLEAVGKLSNWGSNNPGTYKGIAFSRYKNIGAYCALVAEIKVDEDIELINSWAVVDAGEIVNPDGIKNQIEGGIIQATSCTLIEEVNFDEEVILAKDWESYPILKFNQVPNIYVDIIDRPDEAFLGVGEAAHGPTAAAIGNALKTALGIRVTELPITRDRIIQSLNN